MVCRDPVKPRGKRRFAAEFRQRLISFNEDFLGRVIRQSMVTEHGRAISPDPVLVPVHELGIGVPVSRQDFQNNL